MSRTVKDLLAERRANVLELSRERDAMARKMLRVHIADLDNQIAERTGADESGDSDYAWEREPIAHARLDWGDEP